MSKKGIATIGWRIISLILLITAFLSLIGALGFTKPGQAVFSAFAFLLGKFSVLGPLALFVLGILCWFLPRMGSYGEKDDEDERESEEGYDRDNDSTEPYRYNRSRYNGERYDNRRLTSARSGASGYDRLDEILSAKGVPLPATRLVPVKGFDQYFTSAEWAEVREPDQSTKMDEVGKNFPTYFGEGKRSFANFPQKVGPLDGMKEYFQSVEAEVDTEVKERGPEEREQAEKGTSMPSLSLWGGTFPADRREGDSPKRASGQDQSGIEDTVDLSPKEESVEQTQSIAVSASPHYEIPHYEIPRYEVPRHETDRQGTDTAAHVAAAKEPVPAAALAVDCAGMPVLPIPEVPKPAERDSGKREKRLWRLPELNILAAKPQLAPPAEYDTTQQLEQVLQDFGVKAKVIRVARGPVITRYELAPAPGVKISKIVNLSDDIALALAAQDVRIEAPIPGKSAIGIEVPNKKPRAVVFREVLETSAYQQSPSKLKIALGKDIADQAVVGNLAKMPHLLVAGATGSGKSVCITALINSLLFNATPDEVKFLMIDPKMVELNLYNGIPHLLAPVVTDPKKAAAALRWIVKEMETRYELFAAAGVRDIERYNSLKAQSDPSQKPALPFIVVIIDELADLMLVAAGEVEEAICRLAQMARAAGIHLVIATQRPSVDVITGLIKANIPSRISFAVTSQIDSRTILDATGAEKLLGRGDMLYSPQGVNKPVRVQGCLVTDDEVGKVIRHWKQQGSPEYLDPDRLFSDNGSKNEESSTMDDELFADAARLLITTKMASTSFLQRRMKLGYSRAARLIDLLEEQGIVGPYEGSKPRQILMTLEEFNERFG